MEGWKPTRYEKLLGNAFLASVQICEETDDWDWEIRGWVGDNENRTAHFESLAHGHGDTMEEAAFDCLTFWQEMVSLTQEE